MRITKPFAIGRYEVTFEEYDEFAAATATELPDDLGWGRGRRPVINVSWEDAVRFAHWLSSETGKSYRLPSEAEWEYAARSGDKTQTWAGTSDERKLSVYAWYRTNSGGKTQAVGGKKPNRFGLYDMSGNVWEWVEDCWHHDYNGAPTDGSAWLIRGGVIRGGSWDNYPKSLRSSDRGKFSIHYGRKFLGFRLAQDLD